MVYEVQLTSPTKEESHEDRRSLSRQAGQEALPLLQDAVPDHPL
jgi:hypothetical protein